ncbi:Uncharacterised protein [uncultured archaeon]|nr:Uncharacterised protein [uncultured archaeon]
MESGSAGQKIGISRFKAVRRIDLSSDICEPMAFISSAPEILSVSSGRMLCISSSNLIKSSSLR